MEDVSENTESQCESSEGVVVGFMAAMDRIKAADSIHTIIIAGSFDARTTADEFLQQ